MSKMSKNKEDYVIRKKIEYILLRFKEDTKGLNFDAKSELLRLWIGSCLEFEEYEMAIALRNKRGQIIREYRLHKHGEKSWLKKCFVKAKWIWRKFRIRFLTLFSRK